MRYEHPLHVPIVVTSEEQLRAVYAVLAVPAITAGNGPIVAAPTPVAEQSPASAAVEASPAANKEPETDAAGTPFDPERHTGTKLASGLWRMKKDVVRPASEELPTGTKTETASTTATSQTAEEPAGSDPEPAPAATLDEDDEFAAFAAAAAESDAKAAETVANVPARSWTDADLSQLCNDAAVKLNDPAPIKALIAEYMPEGVVPHSRHIPADKREAFARALEEKAGIEYAG